jgi:hypothetical protein
MARDYSEAVHASYPELLGSMAVIASLDLDLYRKLKPLADKIYELDGHVALAARGLSNPAANEHSVAELATLADEARTLYEVLLEQLASSMRAAGAMSSGE